MKIPTAIALIALAGGTGIPPVPGNTAWAATFDVSRFDDPPPDGCAPDDCSLREAVLDANALAGADTINLPAGTYSLSLTGAEEDASATGDLDLVDDVTIVGQGDGATLDAALQDDRVFHVPGGGGLPAVEISGVTITGGLAESGGGLFNVGGSVTLTNSEVRSNSASGGTGGGIYNAAGTGGATLSLVDCTIADNDAITAATVDNGGGGIFNAGGTLTITNCTISGNAAEGYTGQGGGIYNAGGPVTITESVLSGNISRRTDPSSNLDYGGGGAIYNEVGGTLTVEGGSITGNVADPNYGGGIYNEGGTVTVTNATISSNVSNVAGGGIFNLQGNVTVSDSTVSGNSQGGLYNKDGSLTLSRVTVSGNVNGLSGGGGILNAGGTVEANDSTITGNTAGSGGGIFNRPSSIGSGSPGTMTLTNSTVADNIADSDTVASKGGGIWNYAQDGEALLTLIGTTVSGNAAVDSAQVDDMGGGIYNYATGEGVVATTNLIDSFVSNNTATDGGGIYNGSGGLLDVTNSTIDRNTARDSGGGIRSYRGTLALNASTVDGNTAGPLGGGILVSEGSDAVDLTINNSTISNNTATSYGGGLYASGVTTAIDSTVFSGNSAVDGGGLWVRYNPITLSNSTLTANSATEEGGGLYILAGSTADISHSSLAGNSALDGAGLYVDGATANVTHSTFSGNSASSSGGGIVVDFNFYHDSKATVLNSTVSGNSAGSGGGLVVGDTLELAYSTVTANSATNGPGGIVVDSGDTATVLNSIVASQSAGSDCEVRGTLISDGYNLESANSCGFQSPGDLQNTDPLLLPLADNGGPTLTHALQGSSPAVDAGPPTACSWDPDGDGVAEPLPDQRGVARADLPGVGNEPPDQVCDMGAYEYVPLLANGGFELGLKDDLPVFWAGENLGKYGLRICPDGAKRIKGPKAGIGEVAHSGLCMFQLQGLGNRVSLYQGLARSGLAGDSYTLSLWSAAENALGALLALVQFDYADGTTGVFRVPLDLGTHDWLQFTTLATAARDYDAISVRVSGIHVSGLTVLDDVSLIGN